MTKLGVPAGVLLDQHGRCPQCSRVWPDPALCHSCGSQGELGSFWGSLRRSPPEESPLVALIRLAAGMVEPKDDGRPRRRALRAFLRQAGATTAYAKEFWTDLLTSYLSAQKTGSSMAEWEQSQPKESRTQPPRGVRRRPPRGARRV